MCSVYAHTRGNREEEWEPIENHLQAVAERAAEFAATIQGREWGRLAGLWHDLGKYSEKFQSMLRACTGDEAHLETQIGKVDHSTAGAQHAAGSFKGPIGKILAYCIAGHHAGLPDHIREQGGTSDLESRLAKEICDWSRAPAELLQQSPPERPPLQPAADESTRAFQVSVFCRVLFSCLVDADFLATEAFLQSEKTAERARSLPTLDHLLRHLDEHLKWLTGNAKKTDVNKVRASVLDQYRRKAPLPPGLFSLTVPTGGGKTLSSLAFALRHAVEHELRRVIYAIPFTSIIEQNVDVFRKALASAGDDVVLEHHSNLDPDKESKWARLATENWDAPLVVTTNVQLFESLFANRTSRCRKLHRIAHSVIILDECQTLPVHLLAPTLRMLEELARNYGCTIVFCSATQPAVGKRDGFDIGLSDVREIIDDPQRLHRSLERVHVEQLGKIELDELADRLQKHEQVLCIVNTKAQAAQLFGMLHREDDEHTLHLSTSMCARHRSAVVRLIRSRLRGGDPCRVISTQLIEAGVDVDFPVVFRALAGLDAIAQAAGRCNREGRSKRGTVFVYEGEIPATPGLLAIRQGAKHTTEVAGLFDDLLGLDAIERFFELNYWMRCDEWDKKRILDLFSMNRDGPHFQFREASGKYRFIPDEQTAVIVPFGRLGKQLVETLRRCQEPPGRGFDRRLQRYIVGVYDRQINQLKDDQAVALYHERFCVLENDLLYDDQLGLRLDSSDLDPTRLCI